MDIISPNYLYNNHKLYTDNYYTIKRKQIYMMSQKINIGEIIKLDGTVVCRFEI